MTEAERREYRQAIDNARRATERCDQVCDRLLELVPAGEVIAALAELRDQRVRVDELVAHAHGADRLPGMTSGAQAIIVKAGKVQR